MLLAHLLCVAVAARRAPSSRLGGRAGVRMVASSEVELGPFAARVDAAVSELFGAEQTKRVRDAWARMSVGAEHESDLDPSHPLMKQRASSYIDGLSTKPWHEPATRHKWAKKLEQEWRVVRDELQAALADEGKLEAAGNNVWAGAKNATSAAAYGQNWKTLALCDRTVWDETNAALFPRTCELLHRAKVPLLEAFFAKMPPHTQIGPHSDMCNFALTAHLGVDVPEGECDLTVGDGKREWRNGGTMLFDTSILHEAENRADRTRYILMMRVYHPELSVRAPRESEQGLLQRAAHRASRCSARS
jgi:aspartate beta-hydroxylase